MNLNDPTADDPWPASGALPPLSRAIDKIIPAFGLAQAELDNVQKSATGNYGKYANLTACLGEVKSVFGKHGLSVQQRPLYHDGPGIRLQTVIWHNESGQWTADGGPVFPAGKPSDPSAVMAALTYARRGTLSANTGLTQEDDDGVTASARPKAAKKPAPATLAKQEDRDAVTARIKALPDEFAKQIGDRIRGDGMSWTQLTKTQLKSVTEWVVECEGLAGA